ncbi:MAG: efflux RND transporter periplasmic adaptor subunit [Pseudomonadota bacterium]|nr:efflux RND transporter periplasmic adaptor subunit [Pseudomonadota bacterium]
MTLPPAPRVVSRGLACLLPIARLATVAALLCVLLVACGEEPAAARGGGDGPPPVPVTTTSVRMQPWTDTLAALGTVKARESIVVTAKVSETVQRVHFDSGDVVAAGAPLITLSGQQQAAALTAAQAEANEAERLYRRQDELAAQQLIARAALDAQRATRDSARARVAQIRADIGDRTLRAPFAGVLGIRRISPGSLVTPGTEIATLDDIARVHVDFPVPEGQLANLASGQAVSGRSDAYPQQVFEGTVSTVETRIDPTSRAVTVRADFPNPDRLLRPGMLMQVQLSRPQRQALQVPEIAIVQIGPDSFVYRVQDDGRVEQAPIEVGGRVAGRAEVVSGLQAGDRIVVDGTGKLRPGSRVTEAAQDSAPARTGEAAADRAPGA